VRCPQFDVRVWVGAASAARPATKLGNDLSFSVISSQVVAKVMPAPLDEKDPKDAGFFVSLGSFLQR
jgi:hypothetical protein